ncbi:hypothetical protein ALC53_05832 [Atta colombica]|uniref:Uncharacterized protein n=1 Tax=Atta colombica TaxID=520822 RepID=A0A151I3W5_9HYME|nr:hypothetical protein ALC53_05832 [Atta colombica]
MIEDFSIQFSPLYLLMKYLAIISIYPIHKKNRCTDLELTCVLDGCVCSRLNPSVLAHQCKSDELP